MPRSDSTNGRPPLVLTVDELSEVTRTNRKTLYDLIKAGSIPAKGESGAYRVPKRWVCDAYGIAVEDMDEWLTAAAAARAAGKEGE